MKLPNTYHYWLKNAHIPHSLLEDKLEIVSNLEGLCLVDLEIENGVIKTVQSAQSQIEETPQFDLKKKIILPRFIDIHTHLDKGHIWQRSPNLDRTFETAIKTDEEDSQRYAQAEDIYRRMEFGLKCSYAHGTSAIRTHINCSEKKEDIRFKVFQELQKKWKDRIILQAVSLISLDYFSTPEGIKLADKVAEIGGILGGFAVMNPQLEEQLDQVFQLAKERNLPLDFHVDENGDPQSICLQKVAEAAIKHQFSDPILCGHCCSLAVQDQAQVEKTINLVKEANINIVSLPMCNLYLQDRQPNYLTPIWRGVTRVQELNNKGIPVTFASDNCRDPFHGFGDHDGLEVFSQSVKIAHLDNDYNQWIKSVTKTPADIMGLTHLGRLTVGLSADFIIFQGRYYSELLSRHQSDRMVVCQGKAIDSTLPDYAELDDLMRKK